MLRFNFGARCARTGRSLDCPGTRPAPGLGGQDIHTAAHLVYRNQAEIARNDNDALIINCVTAGSLHTEQTGRAIALQAGNGAVSDAALP